MRTVTEQKSIRSTSLSNAGIPTSILSPTAASSQLYRVRATCRSATGKLSRIGNTSTIYSHCVQWDEAMLGEINPVEITSATFDGDWDFIAEFV